ncbi:MAG: hypothetical protein IKI68_05210 [Clostridia bacterium]|nr:hypothetical protein [Clostridia bacterium]
MRKIRWKNNCDFAFTIVDDTDFATVENVKPVYDYLYEKGIITTKTVWVYPSNDDKYTGDCLKDNDYAEFIKDLSDKGYEIAFHNAGSGGFKRKETVCALEDFKSILGQYPKMFINHSNNIENIYWGYERFSGIIKYIYKLKKSHVASEGTRENSDYFWGDICKERFRFIRNRTFNGINTLKEDKRLVYRETGKEKYSNYWFSSSDAMRVTSFNNLLTKENIDKLEREKGCCILYTHFAYDFVDENGNLDDGFKAAIDYLASKNAWFAPASEILDHVLRDREYKPSKFYEFMMDIKWFFERLKK